MRRDFATTATPANVAIAAIVFVFGLACTSIAASATGTPTATTPFTALHWRNIGPFRGGRTVAVAGVPSKPGTYYMAPVNGGIWKSNDYTRTWQPIFDKQDTGSIGAIAVAPSDPNVIYAGSGEGLRRPDLSTGDGIYKSTDQGATWTHLGLRDAQQIQKIAVDPHDPNRLFVAAVGHPFGPNQERGLYRSLDGGATYEKVLGSGENVGAVEVAIDERAPNIVYAALWASRNGPWNLTQVYERYDESGLYKSVDGGTTWTQLTSGLPKEVGRIGISISPVDDTRIYALVEMPNDDCAVYRTSDSGATWQQTNSESRVCSRTEDFAGITADPHDKDTVYSANTTTYRSIDAGTTWTGWKGAPGGDDYHTVWIDPTNANTILLGVDQGATLTTNGGQTWSSWYNQPTAQFYHVIADDRFPYRVFGGQQESGSAEILSRGNDGAISFRDFHPVGVEEYGYVAPDPLHPWLIYGGKATVYDERTNQTTDVSPTYDRKKYRFDRTNPLIWNRVDKRTLYLGLNVIFATRDGGKSWKQISPDLTRVAPGEPATLAHFAQDDPHNGKHRGVVYSLAPSNKDAKTLWAGTDDGLVWRTTDAGRHWQNSTSIGLTPWSRVTQIDASHFDNDSAYVSVSRERLDDRKPYAYRTHDGGKTWTPIVSGIPSNEPVNSIREDSERRGLLFAATERTVYVSFDDGNNWLSLQNNLPPTSVRDIVVHGDDLIVGTHGRSFWILDDITPLRDRVGATQSPQTTYLYPIAEAIRVRRDTNPDTPLPPDEPVGENPPDGAIFDYTIAQNSTAAVSIAIYDDANRLVRKYASSDREEAIDPGIDVPLYWVRPTQIPSATPGHHRFVWDLHYPAPEAVEHEYPIAAIVHATPRSPEGVIAKPGTYRAVLGVGNARFERTFRVRPDPRVPVSQAVFAAQFDLARRAVRAMNASYAAMRTATARGDKKTAARYEALNGGLGKMLDVIEASDASPTIAQRAMVDALLGGVARGGRTVVDPPTGRDEP